MVPMNIANFLLNDLLLKQPFQAKGWPPIVKQKDKKFITPKWRIREKFFSHKVGVAAGFAIKIVSQFGLDTF